MRLHAGAGSGRRRFDAAARCVLEAVVVEAAGERFRRAVSSNMASAAVIKRPCKKRAI